MNVPGVRKLLSVVVFVVVIVQYKLFIVQYKSEGFRAVSAATVKVPAVVVFVGEPPPPPPHLPTTGSGVDGQHF